MRSCWPTGVMAKIFWMVGSSGRPERLLGLAGSVRLTGVTVPSEPT